MIVVVTSATCIWTEANGTRSAPAGDVVPQRPAPPDAVVVTGDIADHGLPEEYERARKILSSPLPVSTCPGNHDWQRAYAVVLLGQLSEDAPNSRYTDWPVRC